MAEQSAAPEVHHDSHGNSVAAWVGVITILAASVLVALGMVLAVPVMWIVGAIGCAAGVVAWIVLAKAGYGVGGRRL